MLNLVIIEGRLTKDPELRTTENTQTPTCVFNVAVQRDGKDAQTDFFSVRAWRKTAEFVSRYFKKGSPIQVQGSLRNYSYERNGETFRGIEIVADKINFTIPTKSSENVKNEADTKDDSDFVVMADDEDLPF